jgi:hypothetical protein
MEVTVLHVLALSRSAVTIRHWFEVDLDNASMEHGARVEIRELREQQHRGSESASQLVTIDRPLWRADLFDRLPSDPGTFAAAHYHPHFDGNEPCARVWDSRLTADPWGWLGEQIENLGASADPSGWPLDPGDAEDLRGLSDTVVAVAQQFAPTVCKTPAQCFRLTRDVQDTVRLMIATLREPGLLDTDWVAPWLQQ